MKPWIKGGIIGAILYPIIDIGVFLWGMGCGYASQPGIECDMLEWWYFHISAMEWSWMESIVRATESIIDPLYLIIAVDIILGFALGAVITLGIGKLRSSKKA